MPIPWALPPSARSQGLSTFQVFLRPVQRTLGGGVGEVLPGLPLKCGCLCCLSWRTLGPWQCTGQPWPIQQQTFVKQRLSGKREVCLPRAGPRQGLWLPSHTICSIHGPYCPHLFAQSGNICVEHLLGAVHPVANFTDIWTQTPGRKGGAGLEF